VDDGGRENARTPEHGGTVRDRVRGCNRTRRDESGTERTAIPGETVTIERTIGSASTFRADLIDEISAENVEIEENMSISVVDDGDAYEVEVDRENMTVTARWLPTDENPTFVYKVVLPTNATAGDVVEIDRTRTIDDAIYTGEADEITVVSPGASYYSNETGYVNSLATVQTAFGHYQNGVIDELTLVQELFLAYLEERPVEE
jgi:hypothetical protein